MFNGISRWLRRQEAQKQCVEAQLETRAELERRVSEQLVELIAYIDRLVKADIRRQDAQAFEERLPR